MNNRVIQVRALQLGERIDVKGLEREDAFSSVPLAFRTSGDGIAVLFKSGAAVFIAMKPVDEEQLIRGLLELRRALRDLLGVRLVGTALEHRRDRGERVRTDEDLGGCEVLIRERRVLVVDRLGRLAELLARLPELRDALRDGRQLLRELGVRRRHGCVVARRGRGLAVGGLLLLGSGRARSERDKSKAYGPEHHRQELYAPGPGRDQFRGCC